jgi:hypothetical protein
MKTSLLLLLSLSTLLIGRSRSEKKIFEVITADSVLVEVMLRYEDQQPQEYVAHVTTPVCKEGLCHILVADLYWDLLGNFLRYELPPDQPLTKFDHEEFTEEDYEKLDKILADEYSLLGEHAIEDLVDESTELVSEEVDAVTGATVKAVQNTVVSGAVYSTYALWHLANGEIARRIPSYTEKELREDLINQFLASDHYPYHYYALDQLKPEQFSEYMPQVIRLIDESSIFVARYALNKIPESIYQDSVWQRQLVQQFPDADFNAQQLLLKKLQSVPVASSSLEVLASHLDQLSEQQLTQVLDLMTNNPQQLNDASIGKIIQLLDHANPVYHQLAYPALKKLSAYSPLAQKALNHHETSSTTN